MVLDERCLSFGPCLIYFMTSHFRPLSAPQPCSPHPPPPHQGHLPVGALTYILTDEAQIPQVPWILTSLFISSVLVGRDTVL